MGMAKGWARYIIFLQAFLLLGTGAFAVHAGDTVEGIEIKITPKEVSQGGVTVIRVSSPQPLLKVGGIWKGSSLLFFPEGGGVFASVLGIDLEEEPGKQTLSVEGMGGGGLIQRQEVDFHVLRKEFPVQRLTLPRKMVELSPEDQARVQKENRKVQEILKTISSEKIWGKGFKRPVEGVILSAFGLRRILNDQPRSPHSGVDLRAALGAPVSASGGGMVVYTGDHFFSGQSVFLDHGAGIMTMYFHLSEIQVSVGERVRQGQVIGKAGQTGRATGPHLHWGARVQGSRVDPMALLELFD
jgi:hypothetical protein